MVWEQQVQVIVMTTRTFERCRQKCGQYWPSELSGGEPIIAGPFVVSVKDPQAAAPGAAADEDENKSEDYVVTHLTLTNEKTGVTRDVTHFQFVSWPDYGVPDSAMSMLTFLQRVREAQETMTQKIRQGENPVEI